MSEASSGAESTCILVPGDSRGRLVKRYRYGNHLYRDVIETVQRMGENEGPYVRGEEV